MTSGFFLHTPQVPPSFAQYLQYLQFLHALHGSSPTQVAVDKLDGCMPRRKTEITNGTSSLRMRPS